MDLGMLNAWECWEWRREECPSALRESNHAVLLCARDTNYEQKSFFNVYSQPCKYTRPFSELSPHHLPDEWSSFIAEGYLVWFLPPSGQWFSWVTSWSLGIGCLASVFQLALRPESPTLLAHSLSLLSRIKLFFFSIVQCDVNSEGLLNDISWWAFRSVSHV